MTLDDHVPALLRRARALLGLPARPETALAAAEVRPPARAVLELHQGLVGARALARPSTYAGSHLGAYLLWWWPQTSLTVAAAPCLMQQPCTALATPRDWCTAEVRWTPPRYFAQLADATRLRADEMLSFAPLVLTRAPPAAEPRTWRVVGVAPPEKGKKRV